MEPRKFSKRCSECGQRTKELAVIPYTARYAYDGRKIEIAVPDLSVPKCTNCGAITFDRDADLRLEAEHRKHLGILFPDEIRSNRERLGLTQQQLAELISASIYEVERWETGGQIQQRAQDKLLRLLFFTPDVRAALERDSVPASTSGRPSIEAASTSMSG